MPAPVTGAITAGAGLIGALGGGGGGGQAQAAVPADMMGLRQQQIQLLQYLLGFGGGPGSPMGNPSRTPGAPGSNPFGTGTPSGFGRDAMNTVAGSLGGSGNDPFKNGFGDPTQRLESFFGPLTSDLQKQAVGKASDFLNGPLPQQKALDFIGNLLQHNPGQGVMDALQPHFQQNLASANQSGARFSSGNEVLRSQAVNDYNLLSQQALQQGVGQQLQGAQMTDMLGQGIMDMYTKAAALGDTETTRRLQLLYSLLQTAQGAAFQQPIQQSGTNAFSNGLGTAAQMAALLKSMGIGSGDGIPAAPTLPPGATPPSTIPGMP